MSADWKPFETTLATDVECGFVEKEALDVVDTLPPDKVRRLAAMALTCHRSEWSDRLRDLLRGVSCLLGTLPPHDRR